MGKIGNLLIKGDLIMYKDKVHKVLDTLGLGFYELDKISYPVNKNELSSIPLTSNILEKNEWIKIENSHFENSYYKDMNGKLIYISITSENFFAVDIFNAPTIRIKYVHQLQHFLFGIEENTNLNIEI